MDTVRSQFPQAALSRPRGHPDRPPFVLTADAISVAVTGKAATLHIAESLAGWPASSHLMWTQSPRSLDMPCPAPMKITEALAAPKILHVPASYYPSRRRSIPETHVIDSWQSSDMRPMDGSNCWPLETSTTSLEKISGS
jgi:hypothetical protein